MIRIVTDEPTLMRYFENDKTAPRWFKDANGIDGMSAEYYLGFCKNCWRIYEIDDVALLYCEEGKKAIGIHFSVMRGKSVPMHDLWLIRNAVFQEFEMIFGWVARQNKGTQRMCVELGLEYRGMKMLNGSTHGKVIEWKCYSMTRQNVVLNCKNLLS
jgi:hypothetical protein